MTEETKFKSASELGLTEQEYCGLVKVLEGLQTGSLVHTGKYDGEKNSESFRGFNMGVWVHPAPGTRHGCGTVCCLGGWTETMAGIPHGYLSNKSRVLINLGDWGLRRLFFPEGVIQSDAWSKITAPQAARALANYLKTGQPNWKEAMKEPVT